MTATPSWHLLQPVHFAQTTQLKLLMDLSQFGFSRGKRSNQINLSRACFTQRLQKDPEIVDEKTRKCAR